EVAKVPTVADLRARRLELTQAALREALVADDSEHFRVVVDALSDEFDPVQVAMAAVKLYHELTNPESEEGETGSRAAMTTAAPGMAAAPGTTTRDAITGRDMARIWIGAGRDAGVRPQDLVGAIANEAGVAGGLIGAIQIADRFSIVEVPDDVAK